MRVGPYSIRLRNRHKASPKDGCAQWWREYQILRDNKIVQRVDTLSQAMAWAEENR